ncbi:MAG: DASS family sodium-coupled anion symporter [Candidatus Bathyarchaeia archaeon]
MGFRLGFPGRFAVVLTLTFIVLLLPVPEGLSVDGKRALAAFVFTGTIFALQPVPLPFAGLMVPVALVALGVADSAQAFETLSRPIIILILGSLFLAEALRKHGITRRLALASIVASGGDVNRLLISMMGIAALLSMWMENTATAAVLIPVALTISNQILDQEKARELLVQLVLGIAYAASLGGMATITGAASNAVASEFMAEIRPWTFVDWMKYGIPALVVIFPLTWLLLQRLVSVTVKSLDIELAQKELENIGPIRAVEWEILVVMNIAILFWIAGSFVEPLLDLPATLMSPAVVGMVAVAYLSLRGIIEWEDVKGVSWGMFFAIAAGLALGEAMIRTGTTEWLTDILSPVVGSSPLILSLFFLVFLSALMTNVINNATVAAVFVPILISLARQDPTLNAAQLVLPLTLATTFGYSLPSASGRMALISATGIVDRGDMLRFGIILTALSSVALAFLFYFLTVVKLI